MKNSLAEDEFGDFKKSGLENIAIFTENRKKSFSFSGNPKSHFKDFCKKTRLYGFCYLSESERSLIERIYWIIFICISFYFCGNAVIEMWTGGEKSAITIVQNTKPIWKVPFPAITICPETKVRQRFFNFTDYYHRVLLQEYTAEGNLTAEELQNFADASLVCDNHLYTSGNKTTGNEAITFLKNASPSSDEIFFGCKWASDNTSCTDLFTPLVTSDGFCYTFNMLDKQKIFKDLIQESEDENYYDRKHSEEWSLKNGYSDSDIKESYPRRTTMAGTTRGMFILLKSFEQDLDYICRGPVQGFKVHLHAPNELPRIATQYFRIPLDQEVVVGVKPETTTTSSSLRRVQPNRRQCYFENERQLRMFRNYSEENCRVECLANFTLQQCDCVAFYMPRDESTQICGSGSSMCMFEAEQEVLLRESQIELSDSNCNCLPACTSISYDTQISQADFNWKKVFQAFQTDVNEFPGIRMSRLTIFFKDMQFKSFERKFARDYYRLEFLANLGGLFALFTGFSILTIAEVVYFLLLQLICSVKKLGFRRGTHRV